MSKTEKAGITFPVARVHRLLRKGNYANRIRIGSAVYAAVVLEYLVAEILELAGDEAVNNRKRRIKPRHIMLAVRKDEDLNRLLDNVTISFSGEVPYIHPSLVEKKRKEIPK